MRKLIQLSRFERDVKLARRRGKDMARLGELFLLLENGEPLPARYRDHALQGEWQDHRECHVQPDWLVIYRIDGDYVYLVRTGSHSDLFRNY